MSQLNTNLCIVQQSGCVHALGFLDQARFFQYQFQRLGANASIAINSLRPDAINFIFGGHAGFDLNAVSGFRCVYVNLEQLGDRGAPVSPGYLERLADSVVIDYDARNIAAYSDSGDVPLVSFGYAPYLALQGVRPIEDRPVNILFYGSLNDRRLSLLERIVATGSDISMMRYGVYDKERDMLIRQAKVVFNCHFYETARFEQARAFQCLSLGTPVISERTANTHPPSQFEDSVFWVDPNEVESFFEKDFGSPDFVDRARERLQAFTRHDVIDQYAAALDQVQRCFA